MTKSMSQSYPLFMKQQKLQPRSTIHEAAELATKKKHTRQNVIKPGTIFSYTNLISGVDFSDQYLVSICFEKEYEMVGKRQSNS